MEESYEYEEDEDTYSSSVYKSIFLAARSRCPVCGSLGYHDNFCIICDLPEDDDEMT